MHRWVEVSALGDLLVRTATRHPERDAIVVPEGRRTFAELLEAARHTARGLWSLGVRRGDHVGILMHNSLELCEAFFATVLLGGVVVPISTRFKTNELAYVVENADLVTILTTDDPDGHADFVGLLHESLPGLAESADPTDVRAASAPRLTSAVLLRGAGRSGFLDRSAFDERAAAEPSPAPADEQHLYVRLRDPAAIIYTSGTTSNPKGCVLSHEALTRTAVARAVERLEEAEDERVWCPCPLFHVGAIAPLVGSIALGHTFMTMGHFEPGAALAMIENERATTLWPLFPAFTQSLIDHPDFERHDLRRVRQMPTVGPPEALAATQRAFPQARVFNAYGMTETCAIITMPERGDTPEQSFAWCGRPYDGIELAIADPESGAHLSVGELGEVLVRGYCILEGYYRDPHKTAEAIDLDGWFHTGDLGLLDRDGRLAFRGRLKDMLKVGGENVAAVEVEAFLSSHAGVRHAEVVGAPDRRLDEVPVAFVEPRPGVAVTEDELIAYCRGRIASYKVPRYVRFVTADEWPMSATKVNKAVLRERIAKELSSSLALSGYEPSNSSTSSPDVPR
jgi:fatty-acyl-CoA synthase/long-chain acyl-CoA synthetase